MRRYMGIIFDIDGTLVDSNDGHARAWVRAFADQGITLSFGELRPLIGMGSDQLIPRVSGIHPGDQAFERLNAAWKRHFEIEELPHLQAQPGTRALLEALSREGLHLIAGTSSDAQLVEQLLKIAGVQDLLTERTTASDVQGSKPAPDIVQKALEKLKLSPSQVLMVGDTPFDVESARRADVETVFLRCGGDERFEGALAMYDSPQDWLDHLHTSPIGS